MSCQCLILILWLVPCLALAQEWRIGIINDPDGFTNIRKDKGSAFEVLDTLYANELFSFVDTPNENWLSVRVTRYYDSATYMAEGYVHRTRIREVDKLPREQRKVLFTNILKIERELYQRTLFGEPRYHYSKETHFHEYQFDLSLPCMVKYLCETKDKEMVRLYLTLLQTESGSADEAIRYPLGELFACHPEWMIQQIKDYPSLLDDLTGSLAGYFNEQKKWEPVDRLKKKYAELLKAYGLPEQDFSGYEGK